MNKTLIMMSILIFSQYVAFAGSKRASVRIVIKNKDDSFIVSLKKDNLKKAYIWDKVSKDDTTFYFKKIPLGNYTILVEPNHESWDSECIYLKKIKITKNNQVFKITPPNGKIELTITNFAKTDVKILGKIERLKDGKIEPKYCQWAFFKNKNKTLSDTLYYLDTNHYRISFIDKKTEKVLFVKDLKITEEILKQKNLKLNINKNI